MTFTQDYVADNYSDAMVRAIGAFVLGTATAEGVLGHQLARLYSHPNPPAIQSLLFIQDMGLKVKLSNIVIGVALLKPDHLEQVQRACKKIGLIFERRNEICHNSAIMGEGDHLTLTLLKVSQNGKLKRDKTFSTKQIEEFTKHLYLRVYCLSWFLNDIEIVKIPESY